MELTPSELWAQVLSAAQAGMPEQSFRTWLSTSQAVGFGEGSLIVEAPSAFHVEWIEDKYGRLLATFLEEILGRSLSLSFQAAPSAQLGPPPSAPAVQLTVPLGSEDRLFEELISPPVPGLDRESFPSGFSEGSNADSPEEVATARAASASLSQRYTFDRFIVGSNNQLASAASRAVAENPGRMYNPLFLYGGVGLGKTHLMQAIGHSVLERWPSRRVAYVSTERFMNELVASIQQGTTRDFRKRFRQIDLLLVDDVHFLERKEGTQEEFFHTFNALYDSGKQVVLTSDRPPKELGGMEARLVSRFEWGLVVDIKPPDYETRVAILLRKAQEDLLTLDEEVIDFVARSCTSSVRELEGAIIKLLAYSSLRREEITLDLARAALQGTLRSSPEDRRRVTPDHIRQAVGREWAISPDLLSSKKRTREITEPRQVAMYLIREHLDRSLQNIGAEFGGRDHSTVIHAVRKVSECLSTDPSFAERVHRVKKELSLDAL
jgi:chromosomal replication initiator protein